MSICDHDHVFRNQETIRITRSQHRKLACRLEALLPSLYRPVNDEAVLNMSDTETFCLRLEILWTDLKAWSKIVFCGRLAFAVKIVVAMTVQLNLARFTRYEPRKLDGEDVTAVSLTRARAV